MTSVAEKEAIGNPQIEDGHTRIANELLEAITRFDFSKRQLKVVLFVIRKTYGYNKKADQMSISQICEGTGLNHSATVNAIAELVDLGVVSKQYGQHAQLIGLVKQYKTWGSGIKLIPSIETIPSIKTIPKGVSKQQLDSIKTIPTKDKPKNNTKRKAISLSEYLEQCKAENKKPIAENDKVFEFAEKVGIPTDFLRLGWLSFRDEFIEKPEKKQADWPQTFRNYIKGNYLKVWYFDSQGVAALTTKGQQLQKFYEASNG